MSKTNYFNMKIDNMPVMIEYTSCGNRVEEIVSVTAIDADADLWELLRSDLQEQISIAADCDNAEPKGSEDSYDR